MNASVTATDRSPGASFGAATMTGRFSTLTRGVMVAASVLVAWSLHAQAPKLTADERNTIEVVEGARRGVVHIDARSTQESTFAKRELEASSGTGFLIDPAGRVLTAFHVIKDKNRIDVILYSGKRLPAKLVGSAPQLDLALLQVDLSPDDPRPLPLGDSDTLHVGQKVIAIGNPMGLHNTVTTGVISALVQDVEGVPLELQDALIQTDAAINPGNSGGPLLNSAGEVIGLNDATIANAQNLGLAVPINFAKRVVPDLIEMGHPYQPLLGFSGSEITANLARLFGLPVEAGFQVEQVRPFSPAALAGLRVGNRVVVLSDRPYVLGGDIIVRINGTAVSSPSQIAHVLLRAAPGQVLRLDVYREGGIVEIRIPLDRMQME